MYVYVCTCACIHRTARERLCLALQGEEVEASRDRPACVCSRDVKTEEGQADHRARQAEEHLYACTYACMHMRMCMFVHGTARPRSTAEAHMPSLTDQLAG